MTEQNAPLTALSHPGPVDASASPFARWRTLPLGAVSFRDGFWQDRQMTNRRAGLAHGFRMLEAAGNLDNFRIAVGRMTGSFRGYVFNDSDVYKWLEAVGWELGNQPDADLSRMADEAITLIEQAQGADGYLNTYYQIAKPGARWTDLDMGHEMYCAGHLIQAAVAFHRAVGDDRLLRVARSFADYLYTTFGPGKREEACGHPEIEMALVELYRVTQEPRYLELAQLLIDRRGHKKMGRTGRFQPDYYQDHVPVRDANAVTGHAVRQLYLTTGIADLFLERGEQSLLDALERQWQDMVGTKLYITGGVGARHEGEAFGDPYELPGDEAYCETCAGIASFMWNWRMLLIRRESRYADLMERVLYNNILAGVSPDACHFFYTNPLFLRGKEYLRNARAWEGKNGRGIWYDCACCPPNVMRLIASLPHYVATSDATGVQIHLYSPADCKTILPNGSEVALRMTTKYPWEGTVRIEIEAGEAAHWQLALRIPEWSDNPRVSINNAPALSPQSSALSPHPSSLIPHLSSLSPHSSAHGYLVLERDWSPGDVIDLDLGMTPRLIAPNPRVSALRGMLALERGPIVYCLEDADQTMPARVQDVQLDATVAPRAEWQPDLLGGVVVLHLNGYLLDNDKMTERLYAPYHAFASIPRRPVPLTAVPYYAWGNRELDGMRVWIPQG